MNYAIAYNNKHFASYLDNRNVFTTPLLNHLHNGRASIALHGACIAPSEEAKMC
jgi:hypothetical protein